VGYCPLTDGLEPIIDVGMEQKLISQIEAQAAARGITISTLCRLAVNDGKLYGRLKSGKSITLSTVDKLNRYFKTPAKKRAVQ